MSIFEGVIGWLAPADCLGCGLEGASLCEACAQAEILPYGERCFGCGALSLRSKTCARCRRGGAPLYVWVATDYAGLSKKLTQAYKFLHRRAIAGELAGLMIDTLRLYNSDDHLVKANYLVVGVPTASNRMRQRGFDHAQLLAWRVAELLELKSARALSRIGQGRQVGAKRHARLAHKDHDYFVRSPARIAGRNILLIDDVVTTGTTLKLAAKALRAAGAKSVNALVFAKRL